jgi:sugar phosphate isomerase/epimerase
MITRRNFLKGSVAAVAVAAIEPGIFSIAQQKKLRNIGFISGILDKELKGDWKKVLKEAVSFGFTEMETGGFLGNTAEGFLSYCNEIGLKLVAGGINFTGTDEDIKKDFDLLHNLNMKYAVTYWPWYTGGPFSLEDCRKSAERLNHLGRKCKENGVVLCWHNHNKEFISMEEGLPFDYLMNHTEKDLVNCELDIYWTQKGGADPVKILRSYKGRYPILHIKDMAAGKEQDFACPGSGIIDFPSVFSEAADQGIVHYFVERDNVSDGLDCLKTSGEYLRKLRFK